MTRGSKIEWTWGDLVVETKSGYRMIRGSENGEEVTTHLLPNEASGDFYPSYDAKSNQLAFLREAELAQEHIKLTFVPIRVLKLEKELSYAEKVTRTSLFPLPLPAFDLCLKCSHAFNLLDSRGAISVTERVGVIARVRNLAVAVAKAYRDRQLLDDLAGKGGPKDA